jgi:hypothetical protein
VDPRCLSLAALVALVGCVDASRPVSRAVATTVTRERVRDEAASQARRSALPTIPHVQRERPRPVLTEGGVTHALAGPLRVDLRGDVAAPSEDVPDVPIVGAARGARGWVFVTATEAYASETFTGRLRLLRSFACDAGGEQVSPHDRAAIELHVSAGRVALTVPEYGAFTSDGASLEAIAVPGAVASAWRDVSRGAVIVEHRALKVTSDGGRSWRDVDTRGELPVMVEGTADRLTLTTERAAWRIDEEAAALVALPVSPTEPACAPERPLTEALAPLYERGYERAPTVPSTETCAAQRARRGNGWMAPGLGVSLRGARRIPPEERGGGPELWRFEQTVAAPFGSPWVRSYVDTTFAPVVMRVTRRMEGVYRGGLQWRGHDGLGAFRGAATVQTPPETPPEGRWWLLAATRRGALIQLDALPPGRRFSPDGSAPEVTGFALFWATPTGFRRVALDADLSLEVTGVVPDDQGGVVVVGGELIERAEACRPDIRTWTRRILHALHIGPDGALLAARSVVDAPSVRSVVGVGQRGAQWGLVVAERATPERLRLLSFDGAAGDFNLGSSAEPVSVCATASDAAVRLHQLFAPIDDGRAGVILGGQPHNSTEPVAFPRVVTFEEAGGRTCLRRVWGVQRCEEVELSPENFRTVYGALHLEANAGRLVGTYDDGRRVATLSGTLDPTNP